LIVRDVHIKYDVSNTIWENILANKLIALKFSKWMEQEFEDNIFPNRSKIIKDLICKLKERKSWISINGDFKSYTQNIRRQSLNHLMKHYGVPENLKCLIEKLLDSGTHDSQNLKHFNIKRFFSRIGYEKNFLEDTDFISILNLNGIITGTPLFTKLGIFYLIEFDNILAKEIAGEDGFYGRYMDDFILITSKSYREAESKILEIVKDIYKVNDNDVKNIIKFQRVKRNFDFLGYAIKLDNNKLKTSIRYKTLRKFIYKYLYEYGIHKKSLNIEIFFKYLIAKIYYLNVWIASFIYINDLKLLDTIYEEIILPDLYYTFLKVRKQMGLPKNFINQVEKIKKLFKPAIIYRKIRKKKNRKIQNLIIENVENAKNYLIQNIRL